MDLEARVRELLTRLYEPTVLELEDDEGLWGKVVSTRLEEIPPGRRQRHLRDAMMAEGFTVQDRLGVMMIFLMTPYEYEVSLGTVDLGAEEVAP